MTKYEYKIVLFRPNNSNSLIVCDNTGSRGAHISQRVKSGTDGAGAGLRRPSRRFRRRPSNLLAEYNRRQRSVVWLETHIWHAKRFHMTRAWGHALPDTPTDKCWRQTFRSI